MKLTLSRRQAVLSIATASAASLLGSVLADEQHPPDEPDPTMHDWAGIMARFELRAIRSSHPRHWRRLNYTGVIRWNESLVLFYGVGRRDQTEDDAAAFLAYLAGGPLGGDVLPIVGLHRTPCGRAWSAFVDPSAAGDCVADCGHAGWKEETLRRLHAFDLAVGRQARQCVL